MQVDPSHRQMLPSVTNSFFPASGSASVAVYWPVCAAAMLLAKAITPTMKRRFLTYSLPLAQGPPFRSPFYYEPFYYERLLTLNSQFYAGLPENDQGRINGLHRPPAARVSREARAKQPRRPT